MGQVNQPRTAEWFWANADRVGPCLIWRGQPDGSGYGRIAWGGQKIRTHRLAWVLARGPIPDGLHVCHTCDHPACIEPLHLFLGTNADNMRDAAAKGRRHLLGKSGEANAQSKLTAADVREMRRLRASGFTLKEIGLRFGVSRQNATRVIRGVTWGWVD